MFFDIGANIGQWSIANVDNCKKIIAIEAVPETYDILLKNTNHKSDIISLNYAMCDSTNDEITFYKADCNVLSTLNIKWLKDEKSRFYNYKYQEIKCKTMTIDKLINIYGLPELIKIDTEGGEYECIKSLSQKVNMLCFEWASETNDITFNCLDYLCGLGFKEFYLQIKDDYLFRPTTYYNIEHIKMLLNESIPKIDWGMVWCK